MYTFVSIFVFVYLFACLYVIVIVPLVQINNNNNNNRSLSTHQNLFSCVHVPCKRSGENRQNQDHGNKMTMMTVSQGSVAHILGVMGNVIHCFIAKIQYNFQY